MKHLGHLATAAVVLASVWLMYGHPSTAATHRPASTVHHPAGKQAGK